DLSEIMDSVLTLYKARLRPELTQIDAEYRTHERFLCFGEEMRQVFGNLVSNALNSMKRGGQIRVRVALGRSWSHTPTGGIRVTIADTGAGIPFNLRNNVFEPFVASQDSTGTGLGLWVTADIVKKHGGTIQFRSSTGTEKHGTAFSIFLPLTRRP
ncbi:MAG TPA: HAMP domain-containing sensor histidine kinase, partial [Terracidiphilus sp.]|nr:HAMP domain-containing sensor histidine kinase [Terracidiphilus sp.]